MAIDWNAIATQVGDLNADGRERGSGTESGRRALEILIGEDNLREAVDHFISLERGAFTAEMVIKLVRSQVAMKHCLQIYKGEPGTERACSAIFMLGSFADSTALPWIRDFLSDSRVLVRLNGLRVLQHILYDFDDLSDEQIATAKELLKMAESDSDPTVRERATEAHTWLDRQSTDEGGEDDDEENERERDNTPLN
jgi:HEAT repeats